MTCEDNIPFSNAERVIVELGDAFRGEICLVAFLSASRLLVMFYPFQSCCVPSRLFMSTFSNASRLRHSYVASASTHLVLGRG